MVLLLYVYLTVLRCFLLAHTVVTAFFRIDKNVIWILRQMEEIAYSVVLIMPPTCHLLWWPTSILDKEWHQKLFIPYPGDNVTNRRGIYKENEVPTSADSSLAMQVMTQQVVDWMTTKSRYIFTCCITDYLLTSCIRLKLAFLAQLPTSNEYKNTPRHQKWTNSNSLQYLLSIQHITTNMFVVKTWCTLRGLALDKMTIYIW